MKYRYEIRDTVRGDRVARFNGLKRAQAYMASCVASAGRFVLIDKETGETLETSK